MKKIFIIILLLISVSCYSQTKVLFAGIGDATHDGYVYNEFLLAYPTFDTNNAVHRDFAIISSATFDSAVANGCKIIVRSTIGASGILETAKKYYPDILLIMPTGVYPLTNLWSGDLPCIVLTGAGEETNMTSYKVEFWDNYQVATCPPEYVWCPSYSNGVVAAKLTAIRDYAIANNLDSSLWAVRWNARQWGSYFIDYMVASAQDGYGMIYYEGAIEHYSSPPQDPYTAIDSVSIPIVNPDKDKIYFQVTASQNARGYQIIKNGIIIDATTSTIYTDNTVSRTNSSTPIIYQYRILGAEGNSNISEPIQVRFRKYNKIYIK